MLCCLFVVALLVGCMDTQESKEGVKEEIEGAEGEEWKDERCIDMTLIPDGGFILVGNSATSSTGYPSAVYVVKTDAKGNKEWEKAFGEEGYSAALSIQITPEGRYIVGGMIVPPGAENIKILLLSLDENGAKKWEKRFGEEGRDYTVFSVLVTPDEGYILAGNIIFPYKGMLSPIELIYLVKTDSRGNLVWDSEVKEPMVGKDIWGCGVSSIRQTKDGGYIITGGAINLDSDSDIPPVMFLLKLNSKGKYQWDKKLVFQEQTTVGTDLQQTQDGGFILVGSAGRGERGKSYVVKTDARGNKEWEKVHGKGHRSEAHSVQQTRDGGYIIAGYTESHGNKDAYLLKLDSDRNLEWEKTYGGRKADSAQKVTRTPDGGYAIAGFTESYGSGGEDFYLIKTDSRGNVEWQKTYGV